MTIALSRHISQVGEKSILLFKKGNKTFKWEREQQEAFWAPKKYLKKIPSLARPQPGEQLFYI